MKYKTTKKEDFWESKCTFCIVKEAWEINSKNDKKSKFIKKDGCEALVLAENENHLVIADRAPRTKAHLMIIPKVHQPTIEGMKEHD